MSPASSTLRPAIGLIGFGAFGRLIARHLAAHATLLAYDPLLSDGMAEAHGALPAGLRDAARCPIVILAVPVSGLADLIAQISPDLQPGTLVVDVGSVKTIPVQVMEAGLPGHVEILGTHPLFGPQSAAGGIKGLKIAVCPVRGRQGLRAAAFLRKALGLKVLVTTPEAHDRDAAAVQGLTHLIAKVLVAMEPLPQRMTTRSFELIMDAVDMVRDDSPDVFHAIERLNPYAAEVRERFFALAAQLDSALSGRPAPAQAPRHAGIAAGRDS